MNCLSTLTALAVIIGFGIVLKADEQQLKSIDEMLAAKVTVDFGQLSLESAVAETQKQVMETHKLSVPLQITIVGRDLQFEGITRNQLIRRFSQREKSLADVLTALVIRANPVTVTILDKPARVAVNAKSQRCPDGGDTACILQNPLAALDDATARTKKSPVLLAVIYTAEVLPQTRLRRRGRSTRIEAQDNSETGS